MHYILIYKQNNCVKSVSTFIFKFMYVSYYILNILPSWYLCVLLNTTF